METEYLDSLAYSLSVSGTSHSFNVEHPWLEKKPGFNSTGTCTAYYFIAISPRTYFSYLSSSDEPRELSTNWTLKYFLDTIYRAAMSTIVTTMSTIVTTCSTTSSSHFGNYGTNTRKYHWHSEQQCVRSHGASKRNGFTLRHTISTLSTREVSSVLNHNTSFIKLTNIHTQTKQARRMTADENLVECSPLLRFP